MSGTRFFMRRLESGLETVFLADSPEESFVLQVVTVRMMNIIRH